MIFSTYVPPIVLENMARNGIDEARLSIVQSEEQRDKRSAQKVNMEAFYAAVCAPPEKSSSREIYDCKNKWQTKVELARGEGDPAVGDDSVRNCYDYAGVTRDFFKAECNRNSIDNLGMNLVFNVHYGEKYMNAFWDGESMTFGDGDGKIFSDFSRSLDVLAHELAHGVTQHTANLVYKGQSGALNEHFSDVFGTVITQRYEGQSADDADWIVGDEIMGPSLFGEALRSMKEPGTAYDNELMGKDPQPSHMDLYYNGSGDNYGVHINSGIPNKAFYLAAQDIGTENAGKIWYHALQNLWPKAQFNDAVQVIVRSAQIMTKNGDVPKGSPQVVRAAFKAVGLPK